MVVEPSGLSGIHLPPPPHLDFDLDCTRALVFCSRHVKMVLKVFVLF